MENEYIYEEDVMETEVEPNEVETQKSGLGVGTAMLIGAGIAVAGGAIVKLGKKVYTKVKSKMASRNATEEDQVEESDV